MSNSENTPDKVDGLYIDDTTTYPEYMAHEILKHLVGGVITEVFITPEDDCVPEGYGFHLTMKNGKEKTIFVLMDEEGNGPGHLDIQNKQT